MSVARSEIRKLLLWSYLVPVAPIWAILSFLPVFGLFAKDAALSVIIGNFVFAGTGLVGLGTVAAGLPLLVTPGRRNTVPNPVKGRPGVMAIYATCWLAAYAAFHTLGPA